MSVIQAPNVCDTRTLRDLTGKHSVNICQVNIQGKAYAGRATQNTHPALLLKEMFTFTRIPNRIFIISNLHCVLGNSRVLFIDATTGSKDASVSVSAVVFDVICFSCLKLYDEVHRFPSCKIQRVLILGRQMDLAWTMNIMNLKCDRNAMFNYEMGNKDTF